MNEVNVEEIFDELGYQGVFDLMDIERWLNLQSEDETISQKFIRLKHQESNWGEAADRFRSEFGKLYTAQYSPSIISRGSAEFFETSLPRFGIRLKFGDQLGSIVNLRRLASLSNQLSKYNTDIIRPARCIGGRDKVLAGSLKVWRFINSMDNILFCHDPPHPITGYY